MIWIRSMFDPGRRTLARHLTRLGATLENYGSRLRDAISSAVGETVRNIVRETVHAVLTNQPNGVPAPDRYDPGPRRQRDPWVEQDYRDDPWFEDRDSYPAEDYDDSPSCPAKPAESTSRLPSAIAVGFHTTLSWLRRGVGCFPVLTALAVGLMTALATYAGGPLAAAVVSVTASAFNLLSLSDASRAGADALTAFGHS